MTRNVFEIQIFPSSHSMKVIPIIRDCSISDFYFHGDYSRGFQFMIAVWNYFPTKNMILSKLVVDVL